MFQPRCWLLMFAFLVLAPSSVRVSAQGVAGPGGVCKPASMRTQEVGCWIMADDPVGQLTQSHVFWTLDTYPTRAAAEADKRPHGTVVESFGQFWLLTIADRKSKPKPSRGNRAAEIGPLAVVAG